MNSRSSSTPTSSTLTVLERLMRDYPQVTFIASDRFMWSPADTCIHYDMTTIEAPESAYTLLHELSHALCNHTTYHADTQLIELELQAWEKAKQLSTHYDISIPTDHIEDCLDTYRDWLLNRATCPDCELAGIQSLKNLHYHCMNCQKEWSVPDNQTCVVRRRVTN